MRNRQRGWSYNTRANNQAVLRSYIRFIGPDRQMGRITLLEVEEYFASLDQQPSSYNKIRQRVLQFMAYCQRRGWIDDAFIDEIPKASVFQKERLRLTPEQLRQLPETTDDERDQAFLHFAMNTGLRSSEICNVRIGDLDLDAGYVHVVVGKSRIEDQLPITRSLDRAMREWLTYYTTHVGEPLQADWYLFPARRPPKWVEQRPWHRVMEYGDLRPAVRINKPMRIAQRALERIGVEVVKQEGVHTIRRSTARAVFDMISKEGYDGALRTTAALLHHKNVATTELYIGVTGDRVKRDALLRGKDFLEAPPPPLRLLPQAASGSNVEPPT